VIIAIILIDKIPSETEAWRSDPNEYRKVNLAFLVLDFYNMDL
jgi:hypothetical protein